MANKLLIGFAVLVVCHVASAHFNLTTLLGNNNFQSQLQNMTNLLAQGLANLKAAAATNTPNPLIANAQIKLQTLLNNLPNIVRSPNFNLQLSALRTQLAQALANLKTSPLTGGLSNLQALLQNTFSGAAAGR